MNCDFLDQETRPDVLREFAKLSVAEVAWLRKEIAELKKAGSTTEEQIRLGFQDRLTKLQELLFGRGTESLTDEEKSADKALRPRSHTDVLPHGDSQNPDEQGNKKRTAKDRDLSGEITLYAMAETELLNEAMSRGDKSPKPSDWEEVSGLYDESVEITVVERVYKKVIHRRKKYRYLPSVGTDKEVIVTAKGPEKLMPGAGYSVDFAIEVTCDKYQRHQPLNRQVEFMESRGLTGITAKTLYGLVDALSSHAVRAGVMEKIRQDIFAAPLAVHADETPWPILDDHDSDGHLWTICNMAGAYYRFEPSRSGKIIVEMLKGYSGPVLTDDFSGYNRVTNETQCTLCHCWVSRPT